MDFGEPGGSCRRASGRVVVMLVGMGDNPGGLLEELAMAHRKSGKISSCYQSIFGPGGIVQSTDTFMPFRLPFAKWSMAGTRMYD